MFETRDRPGAVFQCGLQRSGLNQRITSHLAARMVGSQLLETAEILLSGVFGGFGVREFGDVEGASVAAPHRLAKFILDRGDLRRRFVGRAFGPARGNAVDRGDEKDCASRCEDRHRVVPDPVGEVLAARLDRVETDCGRFFVGLLVFLFLCNRHDQWSPRLAWIKSVHLFSAAQCIGQRKKRDSSWVCQPFRARNRRRTGVPSKPNASRSWFSR